MHAVIQVTYFVLLLTCSCAVPHSVVKTSKQKITYITKNTDNNRKVDITYKSQFDLYCNQQFKRKETLTHCLDIKNLSTTKSMSSAVFLMYCIYYYYYYILKSHGSPQSFVQLIATRGHCLLHLPEVIVLLQKQCFPHCATWWSKSPSSEVAISLRYCQTGPNEKKFGKRWHQIHYIHIRIPLSVFLCTAFIQKEQVQ